MLIVCPFMMRGVARQRLSLPGPIIDPSRAGEDLTRYGILTMMSEIVFLPVVQCLAQRSPVAVLIPQDISATAVPPGEEAGYFFGESARP